MILKTWERSLWWLPKVWLKVLAMILSLWERSLMRLMSGNRNLVLFCLQWERS